MLGDAASKGHPFDAIIVHKLDRFSRDSLESFTSKATLKRQKVRLISIQEPVVDSNAPEDAFMEHILAGMAEFYSRNLSREIRKVYWSEGGRAISCFNHHLATKRPSSRGKKATNEPA
jgi:site-specific DNA recombinase